MNFGYISDMYISVPFRLEIIINIEAIFGLFSDAYFKFRDIILVIFHVIQCHLKGNPLTLYVSIFQQKNRDGWTGWIPIRLEKNSKTSPTLAILHSKKEFENSSQNSEKNSQNKRK